MPADILVQRLAAAIEQVFHDDEASLRLFLDWLALYRAQRARAGAHE